MIKKSTDNLLKIGTLLDDKWMILEFIAKGGMGEVYRAHQLNLKRDVAIKVISKEWLESCVDNEDELETGLKRFRTEIQAMAQVRHPNIVQIYDYGTVAVQKFGEEVRQEYIVMEYIPGNTLRETMSEEGYYPEEDLTAEWLLKYFFPVLDGVQTLHDLGIFHRDLKPENVLMDANLPKLADFGLARSYRLKSVSQSMDVKGSPAYMSPEHFFDFRRADQRADIYSLGKILFEAVAGKITSEILPLKCVSLADADTPFFQKLDQIIRDATAENKEERLESVELFRNALKEIVVPSNPERSTAVVLSPGRFSSSALRHWLLASVVVAITAIVSIAAVNLKDLTIEPGVSTVPSVELPVADYREPVTEPPKPAEIRESYRTAPTDQMRNWGAYPDCDEMAGQWQY
jgi:serine/threonine-protein kinase